MAYHDALIAEWKTLPQATDIAGIAANLAAINSKTVIAADVPVAQVIEYLAVMRGNLAPLRIYAASNPQAIHAAHFVDLLTVPVLRMSEPAVAAAITAMLDALVADEKTGITAEDRNAILGMAAVPWHNAPVELGGAGLTGHYVNAWDLFNSGRVVILNEDGSPKEAVAQGLVSKDEAHAVELLMQLNAGHITAGEHYQQSVTHGLPMTPEQRAAGRAEIGLSPGA